VCIKILDNSELTLPPEIIYRKKQGFGASATRLSNGTYGRRDVIGIPRCGCDTLSEDWSGCTMNEHESTWEMGQAEDGGQRDITIYSAVPSLVCSIVVPTYHEVDNLGPLCQRIHTAMSGAGISYEILVVDDDSADGSVEEMKRICAEGIAVRIIVRKGERGLSSAVLRGFREAKGTVLVCMDANLSHPPEKLPELVAAIRTGEADFVIGSRYVAFGTTEHCWGLFRWVNSKVATALARPFTKALDPMSGFFAKPTAAVNREGSI